MNFMTLVPVERLQQLLQTEAQASATAATRHPPPRHATPTRLTSSTNTATHPRPRAARQATRSDRMLHALRAQLQQAGLKPEA